MKAIEFVKQLSEEIGKIGIVSGSYALNIAAQRGLVPGVKEISYRDIDFFIPVLSSVVTPNYKMFHLKHPIASLDTKINGVLFKNDSEYRQLESGFLSYFSDKFDDDVKVNLIMRQCTQDELLAFNSTQALEAIEEFDLSIVKIGYDPIKEKLYPTEGFTKSVECAIVEVKELKEDHTREQEERLRDRIRKYKNKLKSSTVDYRFITRSGLEY